MSVSLERCMSVKSKTDLGTQCPYSRKCGEYCGIHSKSKSVIRIDKQPQETRILINLTFKKPEKPIISNEPEYYDNIDVLNGDIDKLNYAKIIKTLKHFQVQIQGTKKQLVQSLINFIKSRELIQKAYDNPELCNNTNDFYDFIELKDIPKEYLFIFMCQDGRLYGMDIRSMNCYFKELDKDAKLMEKVVEYQNPYNRHKLTTQTICSYRNKIKDLEKQNIETTYPDEEHNSEDKLTFKVLEVFNTIGNYGYVVDASWFLKMTKLDLLDFYLVMEDIWNHRLGLNYSSKRAIVPNNVNIFNKTEYYDIREFEKLQLQDFMINKIHHMINDGVDRESRILGIHYCLIGLCEVCEIDTYLPFGEND